MKIKEVLTFYLPQTELSATNIDYYIVFIYYVGQAMIYFSYGSNMAIARLKARIGHCEKVGRMFLSHFQLRFHKVGRDGTAKCNAFYTGSALDLVYGVAFRIERHQQQTLDRIEGVGKGYQVKTVKVWDENKQSHSAFTYVATLINDDLLPLDWYKYHVITGAMDAELPTSYLKLLERIPFRYDENEQRRNKELAIYSTRNQLI